MMKKSVLILLVASMFFVFAACANDADPGTDPNGEDVQKADDPEAPIIEEVLGDPAELESKLGIIVDMPEEYPVSRYAVINENQGQVEFYVGSDLVLGRVAKGNVENMSEVTSTFDHDETVDLNGLSVRLRYADAESTSNNTLGIADAYDAQKDVTYMVSLLNNGTKEKLQTAMQALVDNTTFTDAAPAGDDANAGDAANGGDTANTQG